MLRYPKIEMGINREDALFKKNPNFHEMSPEIKERDYNYQINKSKISKQVNKEKSRSKEYEMRRGKNRLSETYLQNLPDLNKIQIVNKEEFLNTHIEAKSNLDRNEQINPFNAKIYNAPYLFQSDRKRPLSPRNATIEDIQNLQSKINSYQLRLTGSKKTINSLEEILKSKNIEIDSLKSELENKNKYIEQLLNLRTQSRINSGVASASAASIQIRNKGKEYEKKIEAKEEIISDLKKQNIRLTEMNSDIVAKLRKYELDYKDLALSNSNEISKRNEYLRESIQLKSEIDKLKHLWMQSERKCENYEARDRNHQKLKIEIFSIMKILDTNYSNLKILNNSAQSKLLAFEQRFNLDFIKSF